MTYLTSIIFTDQDDSVPSSGVDQILNTGIVNTLAGNDRITGNGSAYGFVNFDTLNTDDGNDTITGIGNQAYSSGAGIWNYGTFNTGKDDDVITGEGYTHGIRTESGSIFDTGDGNDTIRGNSQKWSVYSNFGISNYFSSLNTGDGNDMIEGSGFSGIFNSGIINTGNGKDIITANGTSIYNNYVVGIDNSGIINTGNDDDIITSTAGTYDGGIKSGTGISNRGTIDTSDGQDSIISHGPFTNRGNVFLGEGNDSITASILADVGLPHTAIENFNFIGTGAGNDIITSTGTIYNEGIINTGNGNDSIIVDRGDNLDTTPSLYNNGGAINMGDGNDSIIAHGFVYSGDNSSGACFLGEGDDYIKGFGNGDFYGGNGNDTLELTPGIYTVEIWGEGGESLIFTNPSIRGFGLEGLMITSEFEKLKAGGTIYDFTSLKAGQIITVA